MEIPAPAALFEQVHALNAAAAARPTTLRRSWDAKATGNVGPFSRGGTQRVPTAAADHEVDPLTAVTPVGLLVPQTHELFLYLVTEPVTSDCWGDGVTAWWAAARRGWPQIERVVLNVDKGPENHSGRTQFMNRLVEFAIGSGWRVELAYYPPAVAQQIQCGGTVLGGVGTAVAQECAGHRGGGAGLHAEYDGAGSPARGAAGRPAVCAG
ncbi:MAG: hypothetical protein M3Z04_05310, partial [Chloroflexota bacterium]|nr:hypothetical protein [Chloroflexota bacterium]